MDAKSEEKAIADGKRHAEEFRIKHKVSQEQWDLAEAMTADLGNELLTTFWEVYDREHPRDDRRRGKPSLPGDGMANEVRAANRPAKKAAGTPVRRTRSRPKKHGN